MNKRYFFGIGLFLVFFLLFLSISQPFPTVSGDIEKGTLDLSDVVLSQDGIIQLNGQWRFYPNELTTYDQILNETSQTSEVFLQVPQIWNNQKVNGEQLDSFGYGTYRLDIILDPHINPVIALRIGDFFSEYKMFWNGEPIASAGTVSTSRTSAEAEMLPQTVFLEVEDRDNILTVHVSNYEQSNGGAWGRLFLGSPYDIYYVRLKSIGLQMFFIGILLIMGMYHLILYMIRGEDINAMVFGLFAFVLGIRQLLIESRLLKLLFPQIPFGILLSAEYITFYTGVTLFAIFLYLVYKEIFHRWVIRIIMSVGFGLSLLVLVTPPRIFTYTLNPFQNFTVLIILYTLYLVVRGMMRRLEGADIILFGSLTVVLAALNDLMNNYRIIDTGYLMSTALLVFIFCQALVIAMKNAKAYGDAVYYSEKSRRMNDALNQLNDQLEHKVDERTRELEIKNRELDLLTKVDGLTGLYNHTTIIEELHRILQDSAHPTNRRHMEAHTAIAMMDIDHFKRINDAYGHPIGDKVLQDISQTIGSCIRSEDFLGRYGGEEFLLIMPHTDVATAAEILNRIRTGIQAMEFEEEGLTVTISGGIAGHKAGESAESVIKRADTLLYEAKNQGRNKIVM